MRYFPLMVDLRDRPVLLIGGGEETMWKVHSLLRAGARLTVICPEELPELARLAAQGRLRWLRREYREGDLQGYFLVVSDPGERSANARISREAAETRVFLVAVNDPEHASAILPAVHQQGDLLMAISTSGVAPALAVRIKERLQREFGPEYAVLLRLLRDLRKDGAVRLSTFQERRALWYRLVDSEALTLVREGRVEEARHVLKEILEAAPTSARRGTHLPCTSLDGEG